MTSVLSSLQNSVIYKVLVVIEFDLIFQHLTINSHVFFLLFFYILGSGNQQRSQWQAKCLSYKTVPFTSTGTLASLFESSSEATVFDASTEIVRCPFCDAEPLVCNQAAKEVIMFTQYKRVKVNGETWSCAV